jgi:hypothetical protein
MTHLIREDSLQRFETSYIDLIEELHAMMAAAAEEAPAADAQRPQPSLLSRWFHQPHRDLAA